MNNTQTNRITPTSATIVSCGYAAGRGLVGDLVVETAAFRAKMIGPRPSRWYYSLAEAHAAARKHAQERTMYWFRLDDGTVHKGWQDKEVAA